jgi:peptidoglycan-N-acetylmuramic acid deacetylase
MRKRDVILLLAALMAAVAAVFGIFRGRVVETGSWGLSFRQEGAAPLGPADQRELRKLDAAYLGDTGEPVIYLTFDAGYENGSTEKILATLKAHQVPAAFFLVGNYLEQNADLVRRMVEEGHIVGNHTLHHPDMSKLTGEDFAGELTGLETKFREITGKELPKFYRPPQGVYSQENLEMAQKLGYKTVFWSLAYADWDNNNQPNPDEAVEKLIRRTHDGAVILLHATSKTNAEILDRLITRWKDMGYRFAPLTELFA